MIFGIHENELTAKDIDILSSFMTRFIPNLPTTTAEAQRWLEHIENSKDKANDDTKEVFRFVYFSMSQNQNDANTFQEALNELFQTNVPILWISPSDGVIVETIPFPESMISYEQIIHIFIADLSENSKDKVNDDTKEVFRFVYFSMSQNQNDANTFQEALNELFQTNVPILWISPSDGVIVETIPFPESMISYEQFIHIFIADLSVNIRFYIGEIKDSYNELKVYYEDMLHKVPIVFSLTSKEVVYYTEAIPYLLIYEMTSQEREQLATSILKHFKHDIEMIETLEMFFQANFNISETAKKMYMHRNSVQYRLDKYMNETGINIQRFDEAIAVKLALLAKKQE